MAQLDLNCDLGESYGQFKIGNDDALFPHIHSCNIACGFHAGDPLVLQRTLAKALQYQLRIGAHPSYPDLQGFGRRPMDLPAAELKAIIQYQVAALKGMLESLGGTLTYVKPHGALYNKMAKNTAESRTVIEAIQALDSKLQLMGLAGSVTQTIAHEMGIGFIAEAFADRRYTQEGVLVPRQQKGAVIHEPLLAAEQVFSILYKQEIKTIDGTFIPIQADSICVHGDHPHSVAIVKAIRKKIAATKI